MPTVTSTSFYVSIKYSKESSAKFAPSFFNSSREQNIALTTRQELVPEDSELRLSQPQHIGRKIREIHDREFQDQYRHSVAHFALSDGRVLNPSSHRESARFGSVIYLARICARQVIDNQQAYFSQFFGAGGKILIIRHEQTERARIKTLYYLYPYFLAPRELAISSDEEIRLLFDC